MDSRRAPRSRKRLTCTLFIGDGRHQGVVLDLSATGLFVQSSAQADPGTPLTVEVVLPNCEGPVSLGASVARRRTVPSHLQSVTPPGLGVQIERAPEEFYAFVSELQGTDLSAGGVSVGPGSAKASRGRKRKAASQPAAKPPERRFRVRVSQLRGSRSRFLQVAAPDEASARDRALAEVGEGWKVLACEAQG